MLLGAIGNGRGFETQMCLKPQVLFFFLLFLISSFLNYTNNYLQTVDTYGHHHHCSTRKHRSSRGSRWHVLSLWYIFFFSVIFSSFYFICILSFNLFPPLFILSICNYCIPTCSQFTYLSILLILMLPTILHHTCSSILFMSTFC